MRYLSPEFDKPGCLVQAISVPTYMASNLGADDTDKFNPYNSFFIEPGTIGMLIRFSPPDDEYFNTKFSVTIAWCVILLGDKLVEVFVGDFFKLKTE